MVAGVLDKATSPEEEEGVGSVCVSIDGLT